MRTRNLTAVAIICSLSFSSARAKTLNPLEISECIHNYWMSRVTQGVVDFQLSLDTNKMLMYPSVTGTLTAQTDWLVQPTSQNQGGYATLNQQVINISNWTNTRSWKAGLKSAEIDAENQLLALMKAAITSFYNYLQDMAKLKLYQQRKVRLNKAVAFAKETTRLRLSDTSSVYLAQSDKASLDVTIANTESDAVATLNTLKASIGSAISNDNFDLDANYMPKPKADMDFWMNQLDDLPDVYGLKVKTVAYDVGADAFDQMVIPTLAVSAQYGSTNYAGQLLQGSGSSLAVAATLTIPIWDQGNRIYYAQHESSTARISEAQSKSNKEADLATVRNLIYQWQNDEKALIMARSQLDNAKKGYDALSTLYSYGKTSFVALQNSEIELNDAEIQVTGIENKIASEKTTLELLAGYSNGRPTVFLGRVRCPAG